MGLGEQGGDLGHMRTDLWEDAPVCGEKQKSDYVHV